MTEDIRQRLAYNALRRTSGRLKVLPLAVQVRGGLGDILILKRKLEEVFKWDGRIIADVYADSNRAAVIKAFFYNEFSGRIANFVFGPPAAFFQEKERYAFAIWFPGSLMLDISVNEGLLAGAETELYERVRRIKAQVEAFGPVTASSMPMIYAKCQKDGLNCYTNLNRFEGFAVQDFHTHIPLVESFSKEYAELGLPKSYLTVNYGYDRSFGVGVQHKAWPLENFAALVRLIKERFPEIAVLQVGSNGFPELPGCDRHLLGTDLELTKYILKGSRLHIDIEGGLVHLATQLGTKCAVLFGPTPLHYYGYAENINITAGSCSNCYWYTGDWYTCYRHLKQPECMSSITPELVMEQIGRFSVLGRGDI